MTMMIPRSLPVWQRGRFAIGACGLLTSAVYLWDASSLSMGTLSQPGPKFFPVAVGVLFAAFSIAVMAEALRLQDDVRDVTFPRGAQLRSILIVAGSLVAFAVVLPLLGFPVSCFLFCAIAMRTLGAPSWKVTLLASLVLTTAIYLIFVTVLDVPLPTLL